MKHYKTIAELHAGNFWEAPQHPLFSMVGCLSECTLGNQEFTTDSYIIAFKKIKSGIFMYGRMPYDHDNGCMFFTKPRQVIEMRDLEVEENGFMLMIDPDYLNGHELFKTIDQYGFFDYEVTEAIHLSPKEEQIIRELHEKIYNEYFNNPDEYSREIILSHVSSILKYSQRFYKRQFIDRSQVTGKTTSKFNDVLKKYITEGFLEKKGLPNVSYIADKLAISPRYLSDLLKQESGKTAIELIHIFLISEAKNLLKIGEKGVAEIAYELGFENASYFTRLFKKQTGMKPMEFRKSDLN
ncbi:MULTISPECIES: AraC family transcriptional regulator [Chryseobacterium]|uniref:AraC-like DNA-binding protein n=1 Tax=Chryseobacterium geocarposphaerae TaxID=1416776 RepID=A0ABU1LFH1_9FLAO|nr:MULTISPECIES: helix-turn-helix transcriptional regulator [Chryseobacterium]MDR6405473.1 AraC-like DNA-binding protein [Chryseobacterium geocarposphaerae]MDR6698704.1 AraC-like DNA-binding protein [Chryseobacterium ginsenosidimutans]